MDATVRLNELIARYLDEGASAEELAELSRLLEVDSAAAARFAAAVRFDALLDQLLNERKQTNELLDVLSRHADAPSASVPPLALPTAALDAAADECDLGSEPSSVFAPGKTFSHAWVMFGLLLVVVCATTIGAMFFYANRHPADAIAARGDHDADGPSPVIPLAPQHVATLSRVADCRWNDSCEALVPGSRFQVGQSLHLATGVAEINFDVGAKMVVQGPAAFVIDSALGVQLATGKATTEIHTQAARGFQIITPTMTFVDKGTEFGVEVAPGGDGKVHVFKGEVEVDVKAGRGNRPAVQRLVENRGARLEAGDAALMLVEDTGECFIRSIEQTERDRHTVAYWRFEDRPLGVLVPDTQKNTRAERVTMDSSYNGNDLFAYTRRHAPRFSDNVPAAQVPQGGVSNRSCLDNTEPPENEPARELYSKSQFSHAAPINLETITPAQWTIEASVRVKRLRGEAQTFVGRDGDKEHATPLRFQVNEQDHFAITFIDGAGRTHSAVAAGAPVIEGHWYHLAAVSDGRTLALYVNRCDGQGYQQEATVALPRTGSTALSKVGNNAIWTIGRGRSWIPTMHWFPANWFQGWIDEVRISDTALDPNQFLFAEQPASCLPTPASHL